MAQHCVILCMTLRGAFCGYRISNGMKETRCEPEEAEQVFAVAPLIRRTKKGHFAAFGPTLGGRYLTIVFEHKPKGLVRPITGWDMSQAEIRCYRKNRR